MTLKEYISSIKEIDKYEFDKIVNKYKTEELLNTIKEIVMKKEKEYENKINKTEKELSCYKTQLHLWNKFGYCFAIFHYFPFESVIKERFRIYSLEAKQNSQFKKMTQEEEIKYGFGLLYKRYLTIIDENNNLIIEKVLKSISDSGEKKYIINQILNFYKKYTPESNKDKETELYLKEKQKELKSINEKIMNPNPLTRELKMYFDYIESVYQFTHNNIGLLHKVANQYSPLNGLSKEDFIQDSYIGLVRATKLYDIRYGYKFSTYAYNWIQQSIRTDREKNSHTIRLPEYLVNEYNRIIEIEQKYKEENGIPPTTEELSKLVGLDKKRVIEILEKRNLFICQSIDQAKAVEMDGDILKIEDTLESPESNFHDKVIDKITIEQLINIMTRILTPREKEVLLMRCGFNMDNPMTFQEIAAIYNCTRQNIQQIEIKALEKLRRNPNIKKLTPYE